MDFIQDLQQYVRENKDRILSEEPDGYMDTGFNRGMKCPAVGEANKNRVWSEEGKRTISEKNKARGAKIYCEDLKKTWLCAKDAGEELGLNPKMIYRVACGERKTHKGLHFERVGKVEARKAQ